MLALLLAAAEEGAEASKTPFYVAGGAFALWAVIVGGLGVARGNFAADGVTSRIVMAVSVLLALAAVVTSVTTA